jgi:toxin-antitoxin system PIN domain toxin
VIAVDTNILVYAHREESPWHRAADSCIAEQAESGRPWAIPWPCIHEFLAIATHPRIYDPPTPLTDAIEQVECWLEAPNLAMLGEGSSYWKALRRTLDASRVVGPRIHDARVAALCLQHGVRVLWSADRDLARFSIAVVNPLMPRSRT